MATVNTAFGVLPSPKTQLLGGNAGGGVGSAAPQQTLLQNQPRPQQQMAPGTMPTFSQMQQQGQARPAPQQPAQEAPAAPQQPDILSQLRSYLGGAGQAGAAPAYTTVQQRILDQSRKATPQSVALAMEQGYYNQMRPVTVPGTSMKVTPGTVGMYDNQQVVYGADGRMRPYTEADRDAEVMQTVARGDVPGTTEYELRQKMLNDPAYADVLSTVRGMLYSANQQAQQAGQPRQLTSAEQFQNELMQQLRDFGTQGITDTPAMQQLRASRRADIKAEFGAQASALDEEMARRGLSASSIGAGRFGDLAGQQARAITSMEAELQSQAEKEAAENKRFYLQQMMGLSGQLATGELEKSKLTLQERQVSADIDYRAKELQQEAALKGRDLDLQAARDLATQEHQKGQLQLGYAEMGSREKISGQELSAREQMQQQELAARQQMSAAEIASREKMSTQEFDLRRLLQQEQFGFQRGESALERAARAEEAKMERGLREAMQTRELTAAEKRQLTEIEANKARQAEGQIFQALQNQLERELRTKMQTTELTAAEKRQLLEIEANKAQQERQFGFQRGESALERNLRETMQTRDLTAAERRQLTEIEANKAQQERQFGFQRGESKLERDLRIAMQGTDIAARTKQMEAEQKFQGEQAKLERDLRTTMQTRDLTASEKRQLADIEANKAQQERQFGFQRGESALDRALRERFGMAEATGIMYDASGKPVLDANGKPVQTLAGQQFGLSQQQFGLSQRQFESQQQQAQNNFLMQLATALAPMKQSDRDAFFRNNPQIAAFLGKPAAVTAPGQYTGGSQTGGAYGVDTGI